MIVCKGTYALQLVDIYRCMYAEVAHARATHREYNTTVPGALTREQWYTDISVHWDMYGYAQL